MIKIRLEIFILSMLLIFAVSCSKETGSEVDEKQHNIEELQKEKGKEEITSGFQSQIQNWKAQHEEMKATLKLSDEESNNLSDAFEVGQKEVSTWLNEKGARLTKLEQKMMMAAKERDLSGMKNYKRQATPLRDEYRDLVKSHLMKIMAALSDENQMNWQGHNLSKKLLNLMDSMTLTEKQIKKIKVMAIDVAKASTREVNPQAAGFLKLEKTSEKKVLTADQRKEYEIIKKKHPFRSLDFSKNDLNRLIRSIKN